MCVSRVRGRVKSGSNDGCHTEPREELVRLIAMSGEVNKRKVTLSGVHPSPLTVCKRHFFVCA